MSDFTTLAAALTYATAGGMTVCVGAALLDYPAEIQAGLDDGMEWLAARAAQMSTAAQVSGAALHTAADSTGTAAYTAVRAVFLWLLEHVVLRAHGRHRQVSA